MRKYVVFCVVLLLALVTGCSKKESAEKEYTNTFKGESNHWTATYQVEGNGNLFKRQEGTKGKSKRHFILTYKGDVSELSNLKTLEYSYLSSESKGHETLTFDKPVTEKEFTLDKAKDGEMESSDETVSVKVKWDGKEEELSLK